MDATNGMAGMREHVQQNFLEGKATDREGTLGPGSV